MDYGFEKVVGASNLLKKLRELVICLKSDDPGIMPVGIMVPGANGVGKTYIFKAFAKECGWIAVVLKNVRGPYVGQTEATWERIRSVLEAMGNVMVLYDEADTEIAGRGSQTPPRGQTALRKDPGDDVRPGQSGSHSVDYNNSPSG